MKSTNKRFVMPEKALQKMQTARKKKQMVYLYGATGYGKTEFIHHYLESDCYLYFSCKEEGADFSVLSEENESLKKAEILVIDDLWLLRNPKQQQDIGKLAERKDIWLILIGRSTMPSWLLAFCVQCNMMVISEQELGFSRKEIQTLAPQYDLKLCEEDILTLEKQSEGNAFIVCLSFMEIAQGTPVGDKLTQRINDLFVLYMEKNLLPTWEPDLIEFLLQVSVVEEFDLSLAEFITGNARVATMIEAAMETGNFMSKQKDIYRIRPQLLQALRSTAQKQYGMDYMKEYMYNAGLYYETRDRLVDALKMYEKSGNTNRIKNILIRNAKQNPAAGFYFELRKYYLNLKEEDIEESPILMSAMSMLYSILMQPEESESWYQKLKEFSCTDRRNLKKEAIAQLAYLDIALPHRGVSGLTELILKFSKLMLTGDFQLPEFSLTSNLPGVMNGGKDFSEWSKKDRELAAVMGKPVSIVLGKYGRGIVNEALGESFFEKKENDFEAFSYLSKAQLEAENGGKLELQFAILGVQIRMSLIHGDISMAKKQLDSFEKKITTSTPGQMIRNMYALRCRLALYESNWEQIQSWLLEAPDEYEVFYVMDRYRYLTKVRYYILNAEYFNGLNLLHQLRCFGELCHRPYLCMEVDLLEAIIRCRMGEPWEEMLQKALDNAREYHFVRLVSKEGAAILPLLKEFRKQDRYKSDKDKKWWKLVYDETEKMARYYPGYLNAEEASSMDFSENAIRILAYQAEGMTIRQIAAAMGLAETTIKYHTTETYRKLNVKGKTEAVQKAKSLKII